MFLGFKKKQKQKKKTWPLKFLLPSHDWTIAVWGWGLPNGHLDTLIIPQHRHSPFFGWCDESPNVRVLEMTRFCKSCLPSFGWWYRNRFWFVIIGTDGHHPPMSVLLVDGDSPCFISLPCNHPVDWLVKSIRLSVEQNVPHVPERPQETRWSGSTWAGVSLGDSSFRGASIYEECTVETLNKLKPLDPFVEVSLQSL